MTVACRRLQWPRMVLCKLKVSSKQTALTGGMFGNICLQVSAFGDDTGTDTGDVWTVHGYHAKDKIWYRDADIELKYAAEQLSHQSGQSVTVVPHCRPPCSSVFLLSCAHDLHREPSSGTRTRGCCWRRGRESMAVQSRGSRKCAARRSRWVSCLLTFNSVDT
jgi:hypothetical protein